MKRLILLATLVALLGPPGLAQRTHYISPDVPTDDPGGSGTVFMPWDVVGYKAGTYTPAPVLSFPPGTAVDALHKLDKSGHWLLSVAAPTELPPGSGSFFQPEDVILFDGANYTMLMDGSVAGIPPGVDVDAAYLIRDDSGDLVISVDVPTTLFGPTGSFDYEPADLAQWLGPALGFTVALDASAAGSGIATTDNVIGADAGAVDVLSIDVPSDLAPSTGPITYLPGQLAGWDAGPATFTLYDALLGWPAGSLVDAVSCQANPGRVYEQSVYTLPVLLDKSAITPGDLRISWAPSCASGAEDYGIYEGTLGLWYDHTQIDCNDLAADFAEEVTPQSYATYYLVVPHNTAEEGAYGVDDDYSRVPQNLERPPGTSACAPLQLATVCN